MFKYSYFFHFFTLLFLSLNLLTTTYALCDSGIIQETDDCCQFVNQTTGHFEVNPNVTDIGDYAFWTCKALTNINLPDSITTIGRGAFAYSGLVSIKIPKLVKIISESTFNNCNKLNSVTMTNNVTEIGDFAFVRCSALTNIILPDSITTIGQYAFTSSGLESISIPKLVTIISDSTFNGCVNLKNVTMGNNVTEIGDFAFVRCSALTNITLPDSITTIGQYVFLETKNLTNVFIGDNITSLFANTFGQLNADNTQLNITLKTISVKENIIITPGDSYNNNAILENDLKVEKRSTSVSTPTSKKYNCQKGLNISEAIQFTEQKCTYITETPTVSPTQQPTIDDDKNKEIIIIIVVSVVSLVVIFTIFITYIYNDKFKQCVQKKTCCYNNYV